VQTIEAHSGEVRVVGHAVLELFLDAADNTQPLNRSVREYILNQGAFQVRGGEPSVPGGSRGHDNPAKWFPWRWLSIPLAAVHAATHSAMHCTSYVEDLGEIPCFLTVFPACVIKSNPL
jgi:hypothetical protein